MKMRRDAISMAVAGAAVGAALLLGAPTATAEPLPAPAPAPVVPAPAQPVVPTPVQPVVTSSAEPAAEGVPHLASPDNLPPGTSTTPVSQSRLDYLRDLWHAMHTQEVSGSDALLLLTQRPLSSGPQVMQPVAPPPAPAPAAPPAAPAP